jgi:hypothetical protein
MDKFWKGVYIALFGFLAVLVITHAKQSSTVFGTLFTGFNTVGTTLTGANVKNTS